MGSLAARARFGFFAFSKWCLTCRPSTSLSKESANPPYRFRAHPCVSVTKAKLPRFPLAFAKTSYPSQPTLPEYMVNTVAPLALMPVYVAVLLPSVSAHGTLACHHVGHYPHSPSGQSGKSIPRCHLVQQMPPCSLPIMPFQCSLVTHPPSHHLPVFQQSAH